MLTQSVGVHPVLLCFRLRWVRCVLSSLRLPFRSEFGLGPDWDLSGFVTAGGLGSSWGLVFFDLLWFVFIFCTIVSMDVLLEWVRIMSSFGD